MCALILSVLLGQFSGLADALFRATGRFALAVFLGNVLRLLEWGGMMAGLYLDGGFFAVAAGGLLVRAETIALFRAWAAEGRHVIVSSHVLHEVDTISDQVILLANGYVVAEGQIKGVREEMREHPMQVVIRCTRANEMAARVFGAEIGRAHV